MSLSEVSFSYEILNPDSLPQEWQELVAAAKDAAEYAYSPYSRFSVGAAVRTAKGHVETGSNQENAAYPSGLCAERVAVFHANAKYSDEAVERLVIVAKTGGVFTDSPITPCGSCRQVLCESERRFGVKMQILMYGGKECYLVKSAACLLPLAFSSESLQGE
ncbi:MAG: cytidine deaminase [Paludibacteraceae bacterium]|nr:cytidine deaminase [Paludibacteraceae bacterium]